MKGCCHRSQVAVQRTERTYFVHWCGTLFCRLTKMHNVYMDTGNYVQTTACFLCFFQCDMKWWQRVLTVATFFSTVHSGHKLPSWWLLDEISQWMELLPRKWCCVNNWHTHLTLNNVLSSCFAVNWRHGNISINYLLSFVHCSQRLWGKYAVQCYLFHQWNKLA